MQIVNGQLREGARVTVCDDDVEMFRQGYKCINCLEVDLIESAFPKQCPLCGFPMRDRQMEWFEERFAGWRPMGSQIDWDEEADRLERQRFERERRQGLRSQGIWVP